jgi:kynurenine formamidase
VLLDFARWYEREYGRTLAGDGTYRITVDELEMTRRAQGVEIRTGDVLLLRTGWMAWYEQQDQAGRERFSDYANLKHAGLDASEEMARYLWDLGVCAAASDNTALEATPPPGGITVPPGPEFLHYYLLGRLGMAIGEMFYLEQLAADCAEDGVYEAFFTSAPLNKLGGAGSPPNALAIK